jgi:hypothetical protein
MFHVVGWSMVVILLALWSLAAWAFSALATWTAANADALTSSAVPITGLALPAWLAPFIPAEMSTAFTAMLANFAPVVQGALALAPNVADGLTTLVWVVWGVGSLLLVVMGFVSSGLIRMLRRRAVA